MKNIDKKDNVPNTLRKTVVFFITILFVISSVMTIENVGSAKDNELEERLGFVEPGEENWWNSSFYYRKLITINHSQVDEDLKNFPILVYRFKDNDLNSHAHADGDDICFVLHSDNSTKLNHELESYSIGTGWIWVNVTSLSSSIDTKIWMYYGNSTCGSQENVADTWSNGYRAVYHFNEITGNALDSANKVKWYNSTNVDVQDRTVVGIVSNCYEWSDGEHDVEIPLQVLTDANQDGTGNDGVDEFTIELWKYPHGTTNQLVYSLEEVDPGVDGHWEVSGYGNGQWRFRPTGVDDNEGSTYDVSNGATANQWAYVVLGWDTSDDLLVLWENDTIEDTLSASGGHVQDSRSNRAPNGHFIGWSEDGGGFDGLLDEVRVSGINRSQSWIKTTYNTIANPSTFLTVGVEEASNKPPHMPSNPYPAHGSTSVNVNVDLSWTGGDPDGDQVTYDVYLGTNSTPPKVASNQTGTSYDPGTLELDKTYYWKIIAWDNKSAFTEGPVWWFSTGTNQPPSKPIILSAPTFGRPEIELEFSTVAMDPEGDQIYYMWDWGDGELSGWLGPFVSGQTAEAHHTWDELGEYEIKVKAKDSNDAESYWSESVQIIIENNPPGIVITKPLPNVLYFGNQPLFPFFATLIIGSIDIVVNASDDLSGMDKVEFYIKDVIKKTVTSAPYIWLWGGITFGLKLCDIKVIAYDNAGNHAYDTILVWRFL